MLADPSVIVFDVNETLSDMSQMATRFADVAAPEHLAKLWFATLLRDGFALTAADASRPFAELAVTALVAVLQGVQLNRDLDAAMSHILDGFAQLGVHPDVPDGVRALRRTGYRLVTLTNGSTEVAERLFTGSGIRDQFDRLLSVEDAPAWKPARAAYQYAAGVCGSDLADMLLVAVHPWDIDGAARAGMRTAWINRTGDRYPEIFRPPTLTATNLTALGAQLR